VTSPTDDATLGEQRFWDLAEPFLVRPDITRSTMMGFPCLRLRGQFFATTDRASGALVVKLPEARVDELVDAGRADSFAPAGKRFREWAAIPYSKSRTWSRLLDEAHDFVDTLAPRAPRRRR
jgi:hypothetical protein